MVIVYIFAAPSSFAYYNQQTWEHDNPVRAKLESMEKVQTELNAKLIDIKKVIDNLKYKED